MARSLSGLTIEPILPPNLKIDWQRYLVKEAEIDAKSIQRDYEITARNFKRNKPKFRREVKMVGSQLSIRVWTYAKIYGYVDLGTKPHVIRRRRKRTLYWIARNGEEVFAQKVDHPGFKGYGYTETLTKKWRPIIGINLGAALHEYAKGCNHYMGSGAGY